MTPALLLDTSVTSIEQSVLQHPAVVLALVGLMGAALVWAMKYIVHGFEQKVDSRFNQLDKKIDDAVAHNTLQDDRIAKLDTGQTQRAAEMQEIQHAIERLTKAVEDHVEEERTETWGKLADIREGMLEMKAEVSERIARLETSMPGSALSSAISALAATISQMNHQGK